MYVGSVGGGLRLRRKNPHCEKEGDTITNQSIKSCGLNVIHRVYVIQEANVIHEANVLHKVNVINEVNAIHEANVFHSYCNT